MLCSCSGVDDKYSVESGDAACEITNAGSKPTGLRSCRMKPCHTNTWIVSKWGSCSGVCSKGKRRRQVTCSNGTTRVRDRYCRARGLAKPPRYQACLRSCELVTSSWSDCTTSRGDETKCGERRRTVACIQKRQNGERKIVAVKHCLNHANETRNGSVAVTEQCACQYNYTFSDWSPCSVDCGHGFRYRLVTCTEHSTRTAVEHEHCINLYGSSKPANKLPCFRYCQSEIHCMQ